MVRSEIIHAANGEQARPSMLTWRVHEFGPSDVMKFEQVVRPNPGLGEVLVKVEAAGVGPWDGCIRAGRSVQPQPLPLTLGSDLSGEIVAASRLQIVQGGKPSQQGPFSKHGRFT